VVEALNVVLFGSVSHRCDRALAKLLEACSAHCRDPAAIDLHLEQLRMEVAGSSTDVHACCLGDLSYVCAIDSSLLLIVDPSNFREHLRHALGASGLRDAAGCGARAGRIDGVGEGPCSVRKGQNELVKVNHLSSSLGET